MSKRKKNKGTTLDRVNYNKGVNVDDTSICAPTPPKLYPIESLQMLDGTSIGVKEVLDILNDSYRIVTPFNKVRLVFFHAIAYVDNGEYEDG